jgi:hypothetical protein
MPSEMSKAWDARLVEWMSRGSSEARGSGRTMTPKQRIAYAVFWIAWMSILVSTNGRTLEWWLLPAIVVVGVGVQFGLHRWERRRESAASLD